MVTQEYTICTVRQATPPKVKMSQYDYGMRTITFSVVDGSGTAVDLTGKTVTVEGTRIDGHAFATTCTVSEDTATFVDTVDMTNAAGDHPAELVVRQNEERLGTMNFIISVEPAAMDEGANITPEDLPLYQQLFKGLASAPMIYNTASGDTASFSDGADDYPIKGLTVAVEPKQSGSGDPSPTNIRPISGWDEIEIVRTGINIWDEEWEIGDISASTGENVSSSRLRSKNYIPIKPDTQYYFFIVTESTSNWRSRFYDINKNYIGTGGALPYNRAFTTPSNAYYVRFALQTSYGTTYNNNISINYPSTDTEYHAYQGNTYTISIGETVYGGTLDVVAGKMVVDRGYIASYAGETLPGAWISDRDVYASGTTPTTGAQVVYALAETIEIPLNPTQINTLLGVNNAYSDAGNVSVEYPADTKQFILNAIASALA